MCIQSHLLEKTIAFVMRLFRYVPLCSAKIIYAVSSNIHSRPPTNRSAMGVNRYEKNIQSGLGADAPDICCVTSVSR